VGVDGDCGEARREAVKRRAVKKTRMRGSANFFTASPG
jgi:hypothetical protein